MSRNLLLVMTLVALSACRTLPAEHAQVTSEPACRYLERDLTVPWAQRYYWCVPPDYHGKRDRIRQSAHVAPGERGAAPRRAVTPDFNDGGHR